MKRYFVFSDIHGFYDELMNALAVKGFDINNPNHYIISLGDATDRGHRSKEVLQFLIDMYDKGRAILILGNHEDLIEEAICRRYFATHDIHNGATETACQLTGIEDPDEALIALETNDLWTTYISHCIDYYELGNYIFVHGWIPCTDKWGTGFYYRYGWRELSKKDWSYARWANGMLAWYRGIVERGKTIVCGHFHTSWGHANLREDGVEFLDEIETYYIDPDTGKQEPHCNFEPFIDDGIIAIDACTAYSHKVNIITLDI